MQPHETIELAFIVLAGVALILQTVVLIAMALGLGKAVQSIKDDIGEIRTAVIPVAHDTKNLIARLSPKIERTVTDVSELTHGLRLQAEELEVVTSEILQRVRKETGRLDTMFSGTLDAVDKASVYVTDVVAKPVKQISGILAAIKAIVESLRASDHAYRAPENHRDNDIFY
jgi:methyl-accepting chemotaxis protein